ncbi:MAG: DUF5989 family protein [Myxococcota bacterium]|nr:DUF5989 family protein [Myxococcota bacterium]
MSADHETEAKPSGGEFAEKAAGKQPGFLRLYWQFLTSDRRWWLAPILVWLAVAGLFVVLGGSAAAPFLYALF